MTVDRTHRFVAVVWRHDGNAAWYFATLPFDLADQIEHEQTTRRGFGSVRVEVTVGATTWATSLFPDRKAESYLLPVKRAVRDAERIDDGDSVRFQIRTL